MSRGNTRKQFQRLLQAISPRQRKLQRLRSAWGKVGNNDGWLAGRHFELTCDDSARNFVDERTWQDLEFPKIFSVLDSTVTPIGGQMLFHLMRHYVDDEDELGQRYQMYAEFQSDAALRERIQLKLAALDADSNASLADFIFGPLPEKPKYHHLLKWWGLFSAATLMGVIFLAIPLVVWLMILAINLVVIIRVSRFLHRDSESLKSCYQLLGVAEELSQLDPNTRQPLLVRLAEERRLRDAARARARWFAITQGKIAGNFLVFFNLAFLLQYIIYVRTIDQLTEVRPVLASSFRLVGALDSSIAIASGLEFLRCHCQPTITTDALIEIEQGHHPLVADPVMNSIRLDKRSALFTGSNMAGKTTFIKMIGINVILGRTLGFCLAREATIPRSGAMASIRGEHSVESGKSHYFAEIEAIHSFIEIAKAGECQVFLIDELFNGTNTVERLATVRAVLEAMCQTAQVLVTTHDVELQSALAAHYDLYHFREDPDVDGFFDYLLRTGPTTKRNAIRLLERKGFPGDVVENALKYVADNTEADRDTGA